ncbi:MAG: shikimate dehydrogenase [Chloroflexota bacterium]|jgi:shikimate dehydrogenase|nr:shikimate dehydrogenase [Chloroflexota bacterium]
MAKRVVLIGHPVAHSLSGVLQQAAFEALGIDAVYEPVDRPLIELPETIAELRGDEYLGANITVPYKERVVSMMDRLTEEAAATGAVDTITREGSRLVGHNTDVLGFRPTLDALVGRQKMPRFAVVLGAGGGARAVVYGLITAGFQRVIVFNRHLHRAEGLVRHFGRSASHMELRAMPWHESVLESELAKTKLLVNASSVGRDPSDTPIPAELLPPDLLVLDLHYAPKESRLLRDAAQAGASNVMNGDLMLLHQSAAAFELWTGKSAPLDLLRERLDQSRDSERLDGGPGPAGAAGDQAPAADEAPAATGAPAADEPGSAKPAAAGVGSRAEAQPVGAGSDSGE